MIECVRLGCDNEAETKCTNCDAAYCKHHPPLNDGDASTCDACNAQVKKIK